MDDIHRLDPPQNDTANRVEFLRHSHAPRKSRIGRDGHVRDIWYVAAPVVTKKPLIEPVMKRHEFGIPMVRD